MPRLASWCCSHMPHAAAAALASALGEASICTCCTVCRCAAGMPMGTRLAMLGSGRAMWADGHALGAQAQ